MKHHDCAAVSDKMHFLTVLQQFALPGHSQTTWKFDFRMRWGSSSVTNTRKHLNINLRFTNISKPQHTGIFGEWVFIV